MDAVDLKDYQGYLYGNNCKVINNRGRRGGSSEGAKGAVNGRLDRNKQMRGSFFTCSYFHYVSCSLIFFFILLSLVCVFAE